MTASWRTSVEKQWLVRGQPEDLSSELVILDGLDRGEDVLEALTGAS